MAGRKYVRDYRLVETMDERGRIRVETEYLGAYYVFAAGTKAAAAGKRRLLALCSLGWAGYLAALSFSSAAIRTVYVALPFVFTALPLWLLTALALSVRTDGKPMERAAAEKLSGGLAPRAGFAAALPAAALLGEAIVFFTRRAAIRPGDLGFVCGALLAALCGAAALRRKEALAVREA